MPPWSRTARSRTALNVVVLLSLTTLAACGSEEDSAQDPLGEPSAASSSASTPSSTSPSGSSTPAQSPSLSAEPSTPPGADPTKAPPEAPVLPGCSEVWVAGARVPVSYEGCLEGETTVPADGRYCEFGRPLFTYGEDRWAAAGGPVNVTERPLLRDPGYRRALEQCGG